MGTWLQAPWASSGRSVTRPKARSAARRSVPSGSVNVSQAAPAGRGEREDTGADQPGHDGDQKPWPHRSLCEAAERGVHTFGLAHVECGWLPPGRGSRLRRTHDSAHAQSGDDPLRTVVHGDSVQLLQEAPHDCPDGGCRTNAEQEAAPAPTSTWPYCSLSADAVQSCDRALPLEPWPPAPGGTDASETAAGAG